MVVSMRVMSDGRGVDYLLRTVVIGDGDRALGTPLTRYYLEAGTPPGAWYGRGLAGLGDDEHGTLVPGDLVTEAQLRALLHGARDPLTDAPLGAAHGRYATRSHDATAPDASHGAGEPNATSEGASALVQHEHARTATSGFDFTFTVPKSVSVLWGVADAGTQALIAGAHRDTVADVLDLLERRVAATRLGKGGVARVGVRGVIAAGFDHYDSRTGDPNLHTHLVVANRVQGPDGKWRTLDSRALHQATVALSETYDVLLMDRLARVLGVGWVPFERGADRNAGWRIGGVPVELMNAFSARSHGDGGIDARTAELIASFTDRHGRTPSARTVLKLRQQATLETRPTKELHSLAELTAAWRAQATMLLGEDATTWARALIAARPDVPLLRADDLEPQILDDLAAVVLMEVGSKRTVWRRWNLWAEAARQTAAIRFASAADREAALDAVVTLAEAASLRLTPAYDRGSPGVFRLADGASAFQPRDTVVYSSQTILDAEGRLLAAAGARGPRLAPERIARFTLLPDARGVTLSDDQAGAIDRIATSGRALDALIGPAGAGKTTALRALRAAWESAAGPGSVIGLAPSAAAAEVLGQALGIRTENTAKWAHEHTAGRWELTKHQLVIVDEASLAGTLLLDRLVTHARDAGAKVVLVGDWAQLTAIDTGGAFGMLARSIEDVPELTDVRRFRAGWEKIATLGLRHGDTRVLGDYAAHGRVHDASDAEGAVYAAWLADRAAGRTSVMIASSAETVAALGMRARADRVTSGVVASVGLPLHDGTLAGTGDEIVTRHNDRRLTAESGSWVKNGDRWQVTAAFDDGSLAVRRLRRDGSLGGALVLPAAYVEEHVELGYATTVHRAQGLTVDTAHALIDPATATRELLYVAMTRGADANHVYVATPPPDPFEPSASPQTAAAALADVMARVGAEPSATETLCLETDRHASLPQLVAEYETIAAHVVAIGAARWPESGTVYHRVADLITVPVGKAIPADYRSALTERAQLIEAATARAASDAAGRREPWTRDVPEEALAIVALYRAKWEITSMRPLGRRDAITDRRQRRDHARADRVLYVAQMEHEQYDSLGHESIERGGHGMGF